MEWFCTDEEKSALQKRERRMTAAFRILSGAAAALFIFLCLMIRTDNMNTMHGVLIAVTAVSGWACILLYMNGVRETRTQLAHLNMLRDGEKEIREGVLTVTRETVQIPKSIRIRKVLLDTGAEEPERLNLDDRWTSRMPPDGSRVRLAVSHSYTAGLEILETKETGDAARKMPGRPGWFRKAVKLLPLLGIWAMTAVFFSSFVFYRITDTDPIHKITIYMDGEIKGETALAARLEKGLGDPIRMVRIFPFRYAMFGSEALKSADLYIIPDSHLEQYEEWTAPGEESFVVCDPETGWSVTGDVFLYASEGEEPEIYRLYIGAASPHLRDGMARRTAELLVSAEEKKE